MPAVGAADLDLPPAAEGSADVARRVARARAIQTERCKNISDRGQKIRCNAEIDGQALDAVARPDDPGRKLLQQASEQMKLSARGYHRVLRVARTLADLDGQDGVQRIHIAEALSYRRQSLTRQA